MSRDVAIDLGTSTLSILTRGVDVATSVPSVVARATTTGEVLAVGHEAAQMVGRTPAGIETVHPFTGGAIVDLGAATGLLRAALRRAGVRRRHRVRAVVCVPSAMTRLEQQAVGDALRLAGVADARLLGHTVAAALGCRLRIDQPVGSLVVDIGAGTTEAAVLSLGGTVALEWRRLGGLDLDREVQAMVERRHGLLIDRAAAEQAKLTLGGAKRPSGGDEGPPLTVRGRVPGSGAAGEVAVTAAEVADALEEPVRGIVDVVVACAGWTPPEIATDLLSTGIHLVGGTARLPGLAARIGAATRLPVHPVVDAEGLVVRGAARCLGRFDDLADVFLDGPVSVAP